MSRASKILDMFETEYPLYIGQLEEDDSWAVYRDKHELGGNHE